MDAAEEIVGQKNSMWTLQKKNEVCQTQRNRWKCLVDDVENTLNHFLWLSIYVSVFVFIHSFIYSFIHSFTQFHIYFFIQCVQSQT